MAGSKTHKFVKKVLNFYLSVRNKNRPYITELLSLAMKLDILLPAWQTVHYRCDKERNTPVAGCNALGTSPPL